MVFHRLFLPDGKKNPAYAENFKYVKYLKVVSFVGYRMNYVECIASDSAEDHTDVNNHVKEIAPTGIITAIDVFNITEFKKK